MPEVDLPFRVNLLIYILLASLILGIIALLVFILNRIVNTAKGGRAVRSGKFGFFQSLSRFTLILLWILLSGAALLLACFIQSYQSFTRKELVAVVRCVPLEGEINTMRMEIEVVNDQEISGRKELLLKGDQWAVEGDILKWDNWVNLLGVHTMYRLTRVRGRYLNVQEEIQNTPTVYGLVENEEDWQWLYNYGHKLPFVTAVYGNTVFTYPSEENTYEVYVTTSGFMVQIPATPPESD